MIALVNDWMIAWLHVCMIAWLHDCMIVWLKDWMITWLNDCISEWLNGCKTAWFNDIMINWLHGYMIKWFSDYIIEWLTELMIKWLHDYVIVQWLRCKTKRLIDYSANGLMHNCIETLMQCALLDYWTATLLHCYITVWVHAQFTTFSIFLLETPFFFEHVQQIKREQFDGISTKMGNRILVGWSTVSSFMYSAFVLTGTLDEHISDEQFIHRYSFHLHAQTCLSTQICAPATDSWSWRALRLNGSSAKKTCPVTWPRMAAESLLWLRNQRVSCRSELLRLGTHEHGATDLTASVEWATTSVETRAA